MEWPTDQSNWLTAIAASIATAAVAIWKGRLRVREDVRNDRGAEVTHKAYIETVTSLREEVERLSNTVANMSREINMERAARREAEERAIIAEAMVRELTARVQSLELSIQTTR